MQEQVKKIILLLVIPIFLLQLSATAQVDHVEMKKDSLYLNFQQSMLLMLDENYVIKAAELEVSEKKAKRKAARSYYYPHIGITGAYTLMSDPLKMDLNPIGDALKGIYEAELVDAQFLPEPYSTGLVTKLNSGLNDLNSAEWDLTLQEREMGLVDLSFNWAIFTGGKIKAANRAAEARLEESKYKKEQVSGEQISKLVKTYFGLQLALEVKQARNEVVAGIAKHLNDANKLFENGMISEAERLHAEVAHANAKQEYKKAFQDVELLQIALQSMLVNKNKLIPVSKLFILEDAPALGEFLDKLNTSNPIIKQLESKEQLATEGLRKERSEYIPNIAIMGYKDLYKYQVSEMVPDWTVGVGVKLNVFDGFARENKIKSAKLIRARVQTYQEKAKLDLITYTTQTYQRLLQAQEEYKASQVSLKFSEEYLRIRTKAFNEGLATSTEVNDAQLNLLKVKTENLKSKYDFDVSLALLLELSGESESFVKYTN